MNSESGNIYPGLKELFDGEKKQGIKVNEEKLIRFGLGDTMEWRGASFEIIEIKPYPENIIVIHSLDKGIY